MELISCKACGVVLDKQSLSFPEIWDAEGDLIQEYAIWDGDSHVAVVPCPVCKTIIRKDAMF